MERHENPGISGVEETLFCLPSHPSESGSNKIDGKDFVF
jgi:hypothetical protein